MRYVLCIVMLLLLIGCGSEGKEYSFACDCELQIKNLHNDIGSPDEILTDASGEWITEYHYYYARDEAYIFTYSVAYDNYNNDQCCYSSMTNI